MKWTKWKSSEEFFIKYKNWYEKIIRKKLQNPESLRKKGDLLWYSLSLSVIEHTIMLQFDSVFPNKMNKKNWKNSEGFFIKYK